MFNSSSKRLAGVSVKCLLEMDSMGEELEEEVVSRGHFVRGAYIESNNTPARN